VGLYKNSGDLPVEEYKVYEFIVRHFLATVSKDAQGSETTAKIQIASILKAVKIIK